MDQYVKLIKENIDISNIQEDINKFLTEFDFWHLDQISLTSHTGKDDWEASIGKIETLEYPEPLYRKVNKSAAYTGFNHDFNSDLNGI